MYMYTCILKIFLRNLFTKLCSLFNKACVTFQVSDPQKGVVFTFVVKMRNLVLVEIDEEFLTGLSMLRASLASPILLFTFSSAPLVTVMALPSYVHLSTSPRSSPFNLILSYRLLLACMPLVFSSLTMTPVLSAINARLLVLACICCGFWERRHTLYIISIIQVT